jgi:hypothetical protein
MEALVKSKCVSKKLYRVYANGGNEFVRANNLDRALAMVRRRMIKRHGLFLLGGVELQVNNIFIKLL